MDDGDVVMAVAADPEVCPVCHTSLIVLADGTRGCGVCPTDERNDVSDQVARLRRDLETIAEALLDEAQARGFCSEYDDFADDVNGRCSEAWLRVRDRQFAISYTVWVTVTCQPSELDAVRTEIYEGLREPMDVSAAVETVEVSVNS